MIDSVKIEDLGKEGTEVTFIDADGTDVGSLTFTDREVEQLFRYWARNAKKRPTKQVQDEIRKIETPTKLPEDAKEWLLENGYVKMPKVEPEK